MFFDPALCFSYVFLPPRHASRPPSESPFLPRQAFGVRRLPPLFFHIPRSSPRSTRSKALSYVAKRLECGVFRRFSFHIPRSSPRFTRSKALSYLAKRLECGVFRRFSFISHDPRH